MELLIDQLPAFDTSLPRREILEYRYPDIVSSHHDRARYIVEGSNKLLASGIAHTFVSYMRDNRDCFRYVLETSVADEARSILSYMG